MSEQEGLDYAKAHLPNNWRVEITLHGTGHCRVIAKGFDGQRSTQAPDHWGFVEQIKEVVDQARLKAQ